MTNKIIATDWTLKNTMPVKFDDIPDGTEFRYSNGVTTKVRLTVFTKIKPATASAPNATLATGNGKLKLWFVPGAIVRIQKPKTETDINWI